MSQKYDVIVVGGGIVGASIAYHIAQLGQQSVCLLERHSLTSGTTWHAAGLVAELRASANLTRLAKYSGELYEQIQTEGDAIGYKRTGALTVAKNPERSFELKKLAAMARANGVECQWMEAPAIHERWQHINTEDLLGGVYMPRDGQTNPVDTTLALARLAKQYGAVIQENTPVTELLIQDDEIVGLKAGNEQYQSRQVVLCAGLWTRELGLSVGAHFPLYPAEHYYAVTEPVELPGTSDDLPIIRVPDDSIYVKPDAGRLLIGSFERHAKSISTSRIPTDHGFVEFPFDIDHFAPYLNHGLNRILGVGEIGIRTWFNGPESFTPDGRYMLGESPQVKQLFVASGFNSIGIQSAGGVGKVMAQWLSDRRPPMDLWEVDVRRFDARHNEESYLAERTQESLGLLYAIHWPYFQNSTSRNLRLSPLHKELQQQGACFGELAGWERANWYSNPNDAPTYEYSYGKQNWFEQARLEHSAVRQDVALFDQSSFSKYLIRGVDACAFLNHLCTAQMDVDIGSVVYCQWLNERGGIEADITVTRLHEGIYWVVSGAACATRDLHWMQSNQGAFNIQIDDITERYAVIGIMGPNARKHLQQHTEHTLNDEHFPFATSQQIEIAGVLLRATRITYVGALGWELYIPWAQAAKVYAALIQSPTGTTIKHAGYHAMDSLRIEKGYRHWGHDITDEDNPIEAGLSFTIDWEKDFIGKEALNEQKQEGVSRRLLLFKLDNPDTLLVHDEPIWRDNIIVGHICSSAFSYQYNCSLAFGYVQAASRQAAVTGAYEIEVADQRFTAQPSLRGLYDPDNLEIRK